MNVLQNTFGQSKFLGYQDLIALSLCEVFVLRQSPVHLLDSIIKKKVEMQKRALPRNWFTGVQCPQLVTEAIICSFRISIRMALRLFVNEVGWSKLPSSHQCFCFRSAKKQHSREHEFTSVDCSTFQDWLLRLKKALPIGSYWQLQFFFSAPTLLALLGMEAKVQRAS